MVGIRGQVVASHIRGDTFVPLDSTRYESKPPTDGHPKTAGNPLKHIEHNTSGRATTQPHFGPTPFLAMHHPLRHCTAGIKIITQNTLSINYRKPCYLPV